MFKEPIPWSTLAPLTPSPTQSSTASTDVPTKLLSDHHMEVDSTDLLQDQNIGISIWSHPSTPAPDPVHRADTAMDTSSGLVDYDGAGTEYNNIQSTPPADFTALPSACLPSPTTISSPLRSPSQGPITSHDSETHDDSDEDLDSPEALHSSDVSSNIDTAVESDNDVPSSDDENPLRFFRRVFIPVDRISRRASQSYLVPQPRPVEGRTTFYIDSEGLESSSLSDEADEPDDVDDSDDS
jgi:hypothetical protein